ncbi:MAG: CAP domain-containing protein [Thermoanaerobaculia bacterium]|nr:CAP domain-containing protein [Thermoanaerobaculia bacterium]
MAAALIALLLATAPASPGDPVCGADGREPARRALLDELNRARREAGAVPVAPHPAVCEFARERAARVRETGDPSASLGQLQRMVRGMYENGYHPHAWTQSVIIGDPLTDRLEQWRAVRPDSYREAVEGDFEHAGIGVETLHGQPVFAVVLALSRCTVERRRADELADLETVRREALSAVNRLRAGRGLDPVASDPDLDRAAQDHAAAMRDGGFYSHRGVGGSSPRERARAAGYSQGAAVSENIAKGIFGGAEVVERWMGSRGHRDNLLDPKMRAVGLGVAVGDRDHPGECVEAFWAQLLGGAAPADG